IGASLGADVPACVRSRTAVGLGVGEDLAPGPDLSGLRVLLVNPGVAVPTGPVFRAWDGVDRGPLGADWRHGGNGVDWRHGRNDLEAPAIALQPVIADVLGWLGGLPGATVARMSGSGATCFALFDGAVPDVQPPHGWWAMPTVLL
ncbi:MAG: 4-(cytidine 5'-diphospho)-2-C-methyl-D-erythritol kinase, partial [Sandaracinobacteroides sp.]